MLCILKKNSVNRRSRYVTVGKLFLFVDSDCITQAAEEARSTAVNSHLLAPCHSAENLDSQYSTLSLTPPLF